MDRRRMREITYLRERGIPALLNNVLSSLLRDRPKDAEGYLRNMFAQLSEGMEDSGQEGKAQQQGDPSMVELRLVERSEAEPLRDVALLTFQPVGNWRALESPKVISYVVLQVAGSEEEGKPKQVYLCPFDITTRGFTVGVQGRDGPSTYLRSSLKVGSTVVASPEMPTAEGTYSRPPDGEPRLWRHHLLLAGGTGILGVLQILQAAVHDPQVPDGGESLRYVLVHCVSTEDHLLMVPIVRAIETSMQGRLTVHHLISRPHDPGYKPQGRVSAGFLREVGPEAGSRGRQAVLVGSGGFKGGAKQALLEAGWAEGEIAALW